MEELTVWINGQEPQTESNFVDNGTEISFLLQSSIIEKDENNNNKQNESSNLDSTIPNKCLIRILSSGDKRKTKI